MDINKKFIHFADFVFYIACTYFLYFLFSKESISGDSNVSAASYRHLSTIQFQYYIIMYPFLLPLILLLIKKESSFRIMNVLLVSLFIFVHSFGLIYFIVQ
jgi:hypothetical protein